MKMHDNSPSERFLIDFHDRIPCQTSLAFGELSVERDGKVFRSSYASLIDMVESTERVILDAACGDGYLLAQLAGSVDADVRLIGADFSVGELAHAKQRLQTRAELYQCRLQSLPIASQSVDHVVSHMALMLMDDLDHVLQEIHRVLVPKGRLSFIISGASTERSPALVRYIQCLRSVLERKHSKFMCFGDARLRHQSDIKQVLLAWFKGIHVEEIVIRRHYTPEQCWAWMERTYDPALLTAEERTVLKQEYLLALDEAVGVDGTLELVDTLWQVGAVAR